MNKKLTIGITTHADRCVWLRDMLNGLYHFTNTDFNLIIIDNNSYDNTPEYLKQLSHQKKIMFIRNPVNHDDTYGMNQILSYVETEFLLKIDSDTLFTHSGSVDSILQSILAENVSLIGPYWDLSLRRRKEIETWCHSIGMNNSFKVADSLAQTVNKHFEVTLRLPRGNFMLMRVADIKHVGGFDDRYPHNAMEYSLAMRLIEAGFDYAAYEDDGVLHRPSDEIRLHTRKLLPDILCEEY